MFSARSLRRASYGLAALAVTLPLILVVMVALSPISHGRGPGGCLWGIFDIAAFAGCVLLALLALLFNGASALREKGRLGWKRWLDILLVFFVPVAVVGGVVMWQI